MSTCAPVLGDVYDFEDVEVLDKRPALHGVPKHLRSVKPDDDYVFEDVDIITDEESDEFLSGWRSIEDTYNISDEEHAKSLNDSLNNSEHAQAKQVSTMVKVESITEQMYVDIRDKRVIENNQDSNPKL